MNGRSPTVGPEHGPDPLAGFPLLILDVISAAKEIAIAFFHACLRLDLESVTSLERAKAFERLVYTEKTKSWGSFLESLCLLTHLMMAGPWSSEGLILATSLSRRSIPKRWEIGLEKSITRAIRQQSSR